MITDREDLVSFIKSIGRDRFCVQAGGGNISVKYLQRLHVKRSGVRMLDMSPDDFASVDLDKVNQHSTEDIQNGPLSIEYSLHASFPYKFVVHIHHVIWIRAMIQSKCISRNWEIPCQRGVNSFLALDYVKPGSELARALSESYAQTEEHPQVVFLQNHGVVFGADTISDLTNVWKNLSSANAKPTPRLSWDITPAPIPGWNHLDLAYFHLPDGDLTLQDFADEAWALYPDQVAILGPNSISVQSIGQLKNLSGPYALMNNDIYIKNTIKLNELEQLVMYLDVINSLSLNDIKNVLNKDQVSEIANWDQEIYRKNLP